ncbi:GntR family transcriptional regulator [Streptomyces sp. NPDC004134]|uniref:GntR family transcriptional regulator n=1 Tax=Streptomyces sp. NPDC004134 TaxID=3364691 RepID=UPI003698F5E5
MGTTQPDTVTELKYWHLKGVISEALESEFSVGEILPNERELAARFGVARATLRQALDQLELEGRLQRRRGVGTTVAPPRVGVPVGSPREMWPGEADDGWEAVDAAAVAAPAAVARMLGTDATEPVHRVHRSRSRNGQPVAAELIYVPGVSAPGFSRGDSSAGAVRARNVLHELHRLPLEGQDRTVELGSARAEDARELDRLPGAPVLVVTTRYVSRGRTAAVAVSTYRADTCRLTLDADAAVLAS